MEERRKVFYIGRIKDKKFSIFVVLVTALLLYLSACAGTAPTPNVSDSDAPGNSTIIPEPPSDADPGYTLDEKLQNAVQHIHKIGLSGGKIILDGDMENIYGEIIYLCHDDKYNYYIQSKDFHISGALLSDLDALYSIEQDALEENEYTLKARELAEVLFPYMDMAYLNFTPYYDIDPIGSVSFHIIEKREDCLVNNGTLDLSRNGTLKSFGSSSYSFDDFRDSYNFTKDEICESAFIELLEQKKIVEASGGYDPGAEYGIIGLPPVDGGNFFGDIDDGNPKITLPPFEMYLNTKDDVKFIRTEKEVYGDKILWSAEAQVKTSWGKIDSIFNYIWFLQFDAVTGERAGDIEVLSGYN